MNIIIEIKLKFKFININHLGKNPIRGGMPLRFSIISIHNNLFKGFIKES